MLWPTCSTTSTSTRLSAGHALRRGSSILALRVPGSVGRFAPYWTLLWSPDGPGCSPSGGDGLFLQWIATISWTSIDQLVILMDMGSSSIKKVTVNLPADALQRAQEITG